MAKTKKISNFVALTSKITDLGQKIEPISNRLDQLELNCNEKIKKFEQVMSKSASDNDLDEAYQLLYNLERFESEQKA